MVNHLLCVEVVDPMLDINNEEMVLRNTYLNALLIPEVPYMPKGEKQVRVVKWVDGEENKAIATVIEDKPINERPRRVSTQLKTVMKKEDPTTEIKIITTSNYLDNVEGGYEIFPNTVNTQSDSNFA